jgi:hypothetical protein
VITITDSTVIKLVLAGLASLDYAESSVVLETVDGEIEDPVVRSCDGQRVVLAVEESEDEFETRHVPVRDVVRIHLD